MNYKPGEQDLMAYLYDELEGEEKARIERYLLQNPEARKELEKLSGVSKLLGTIKDKEVIAPPIFLGDTRSRWIWDAPYFKTIVSIAASLIIVVLVAKFAGISINASGNEFRLGFNAPPETLSQPVAETQSLTPEQVQQMINQSLQANNNVLNDSWLASQERLEKSIKSNLVINSDHMDKLVKQASLASREQVQQYVSSLQDENMKMVKDYFALNSNDQKQYIEGLLVDFAKYLQQQRKDDLQLVQMQLHSLEQNTNVFKEETEQILTSIISSVGNTAPTENKY